MPATSSDSQAAEADADADAEAEAADSRRRLLSTAFISSYSYYTS